MLNVPTQPQSLPGEMWGITTFYNPAGYRSKLPILQNFSQRVRSQGLRLMVVELAFGDAPFEVPQELCERRVQLRTESVLWQKERLLNIALSQLPAGCDKVAWLDADILFEQETWVEQTARQLESCVVIQPFDTACWLSKGRTTAPETFDGTGNQEGQSLPGMGYAMSQAADKRAALGSYFKHGHTGFAWAIRRCVIDRHGFYDGQILGNGDFVMAHAMYGDEDFWGGSNWECKRLSPRLLQDVTRWGRAFYADVRGNVGYVAGRVLHLWHGDQADRQYNSRLDILKQHDFDPQTDLELDDSGCWRWASDKPGLHAWAEAYFRSRRED